MKLEKAIQILTLMGTPEFQGYTEDILKARQLGIEALKTIKEWRNYPFPDGVIQLPSETKE